ncbi:MAG: 2-amino-4-hydroxy-6-hydroxymethyldihydropteridine diphosphokinase [Alphaproteobacteria bacterium]|nr:2-amino-4-hydroxy-6-hydroxymethyldihydropteridine diphosphokinase [Alphaproteobacteria bacterium]MBE8221043.1 2-amino-4-hydroxy-6-hydroxymethyldihydropteridine diphosphokinase [Alphaproteobacteria bacterium]
MIYIGLGSNLRGAYADSVSLLRAALVSFSSSFGGEAEAADSVRVVRCSRFYSSAAVGPGSQPDYVNAVAQIETSLSPSALLAALQGLERQFGRDRAQEERWGARTLDLDILDYRGQIGTNPNIPHPRLPNRAFVLKPLQDIAPAWVHPITNEPLAALLSALLLTLADSGQDTDCRAIMLDSKAEIG